MRVFNFILPLKLFAFYLEVKILTLVLNQDTVRGTGHIEELLYPDSCLPIRMPNAWID